MASPQTENGYTKIANELFDALIAYRLPGEQRQCLDAIMRKTYGFNKKSDAISLSQFAEMTGLKKPTVCRALSGLLSKKIICVIKNDNSKANVYEIIKDFNKWKVLPKKITGGIKKDNRVLSKKIHTKDTITKETTRAKKLPLIHALKKHLKTKITENHLETHQDKILEFYDYRMSMPKRDRYRTEKGLNGLVRDINNCLKKNFDIGRCIDIAMERDWKTPNPEYFNSLAEVKAKPKVRYIDGEHPVSANRPDDWKAP